MSTLFASPSRRICLNCIRRCIDNDLVQWSGPSLTQFRGKKKTAKKIETINVRLLVDVKGYGRKGLPIDTRNQIIILTL